jgi:hypothetical protein
VTRRRASAWDALGAGLVLLAAVAFSAIRVQAVNLPWHMAVARTAQATGHWLSLNTFSYTFPDYPMFQQYPAFEAVVWGTYRLAGWAGLSLLSCTGWTLAFLLMVRWAGPFRAGIVLHPFWMLGLYALQRRMVLRPDMFTMLALGGELLALDAFARGRRWAIALVPAFHLVWVNSHQLFPLSLVVQALFVTHVLALRHFPSLRGEQTGPPPGWLPPVLALATSVLLTFVTPLGLRIVEAPGHTARSLAVFHGAIAEFHPIWTMRLELGLALMTGLPGAFALWRTRRRPHLFDLGIWILSLSLALAAVRGLMFLGVVSIAVIQRSRERARANGIALLPEVGPATHRLLRTVGLTLSVLLAGNVVYHRWIRPPLVLGGTQPGLGRCVGGWAESGMDFLRRSAPPGRMLNLGASLGDDVIFGVPGLPVFVDSRFESYPADFLREVLAAQEDDALLTGLIRRWDARWAVVEHTRDNPRARAVHLLAAGWVPVYVDSSVLILVEDGPASRAFLAAHRIDIARATPGDLVAAPLALRAQQRANFARLMRSLALENRVEEQRRAAAQESGGDGIAAFSEL